MNLEHPFFKKQRSIKAFKAFRDESSLAYHAQKDDPAVAELDAALMSCPDELAGAAPYLRAGRSLNVGACCVVAQYEAKIVTARCISGADIPATSLFSAEKVAAIRSDPELLKPYILHIVQLENSIMTLEKQLLDVYFHKIINGMLVETVDYRTTLDIPLSHWKNSKNRWRKLPKKAKTWKTTINIVSRLLKSSRKCNLRYPLLHSLRSPSRRSWKSRVCSTRRKSRSATEN